jgi:hypothetical protein
MNENKFITTAVPSPPINYKSGIYSIQIIPGVSVLSTLFLSEPQKLNEEIYIKTLKGWASETIRDLDIKHEEERKQCLQEIKTAVEGVFNKFVYYRISETEETLGRFFSNHSKYYLFSLKLKKKNVYFRRTVRPRAYFSRAKERKGGGGITKNPTIHIRSTITTSDV